MLELNAIYVRSNTRYSSHSKSENRLAVQVIFGHFFNGLKAQVRFDRPEYSMNECNLYRGERNGQLNFFSPYFFSLFFSLLPNFFGRFCLISLLRGLFYLLLHRSASFPRVLKEDKHTKHVCHVVISRSSHTTFRFCTIQYNNFI